ncbi:Hypothetical protein A7982_06683 [Minicystis rosea]|nr:Hypothetical protein A7982_06683 [Minicystis rosea]
MVLASVGCSPSVAKPVKDAYDAAVKADPEVGPNKKDPAACPITLQLVNGSGDEPRMISEVACVSLSGNTIALPTTMRLWISEAGWDHYRVCQDNSVKKVANVAGVEECVWNGTYRYTYPFTMRLHSNADKGLASQIKAARVFLNGDLVWKWVPQANDATTDLVIPGSELKRMLLPEGAPIDLRIIPQGVEVDQAVLAAKVEVRPAQWKRQLEIAGDAILTSPSFAQGKLKEKVQCIVYRAKSAAYNASQISGSKSQSAPTLPPECPATPAIPVPNSLSARYADLKTKSVQEFNQELNQLEASFKASVAQYSSSVHESDTQALKAFKERAKDFFNGKGGDGTFWGELDGKGVDRTAQRQALLALFDNYPEAKKAILAGRENDIWGKPPVVKVPAAALPARPTREELVWVSTRGTIQQLEAALDNVDAMIKQGLDAIDQTVVLQGELRKDVVRFANSTDEQARLFLRVANNLQGTSPFEQMRDNPEALPGERALGMRYSDRWQFFGIAPWTGFPVGLNGQADFSAANLIPIIDVVGIRYQWVGSRFADVRAGLGLTALSFSIPDPKTPTSSTSQFRFAPELNLGLANLKVGVSFAVGGTGLTDTERLRVLFGADLYKLISGNNLEVF